MAQFPAGDESAKYNVYKISDHFRPPVLATKIILGSQQLVVKWKDTGQ